MSPEREAAYRAAVKAAGEYMAVHDAADTFQLAETLTVALGVVASLDDLEAAVALPEPPENRKIVQVATLPGRQILDEVNRVRHVISSATLALCDDGTVWAMEHHHPEPRSVKWVPYPPIPSGWGAP